MGRFSHFYPLPPDIAPAEPQFLTQSTITPIGIRECLAVISLYFYVDTAWFFVPDLKANQTDESYPSEEKPAQSSDHYDRK